MDNVKFNKLLNDKYFLFQDISKKYNYNEELLNMITFIYLSFYMDFGKSCDPVLYDLFNKVKIIYEHGSVDEIALRNDFGKISGGTAAATIFTPNLKVFDNPSLKQKPQTILLGTHVGEYLATSALKLEFLVHEVRHALMGYYRTNFLLDENTYYMRSGCEEIYYVKNKDIKEGFSTKSIGTILDEITNTYITEILVNRIMSFRKYKIENNNLKKYLDSVRTKQADGKYRVIGYQREVKLLYPLLLNEMFINLINQHQFDGEIDVIKDFINMSTSICSYEQFCELLDTVYNNNEKYSQAVQNNDMDFVHKHIQDINFAKSIVLDIQKSLVKKP